MELNRDNQSGEFLFPEDAAAPLSPPEMNPLPSRLLFRLRSRLPRLRLLLRKQ